MQVMGTPGLEIPSVPDGAAFKADDSFDGETGATGWKGVKCTV